MSSEVDPRRAQGWQNHTIPDSDSFKLAAVGWMARGFEVFEFSRMFFLQLSLSTSVVELERHQTQICW